MVPVRLSWWSYRLLIAGGGCFPEVLRDICGGFTKLYDQDVGKLSEFRIGRSLLSVRDMGDGARVLRRFCGGFSGLLPIAEVHRQQPDKSASPPNELSFESLFKPSLEKSWLNDLVK